MAAAEADDPPKRSLDDYLDMAHFEHGGVPLTVLHPSCWEQGSELVLWDEHLVGTADVGLLPPRPPTFDARLRLPKCSLDELLGRSGRLIFA